MVEMFENRGVVGYTSTMKHTCSHKHFSYDSLKKRLTSVGVRTTGHRLDILAYLDQSHSPLSAQQIFAHLKNIDLVTIYRSLELFASTKIVRMIDYKKDEKLYELVRGDDHHHIVCTTCGKVGDFDGCLSDAMIRSALKQNRDFATVDSHSFELFGVCKKCYTKHI